jgi:hypothetical protein
MVRILAARTRTLATRSLSTTVSQRTVPQRITAFAVPVVTTALMTGLVGLGSARVSMAQGEFTNGNDHVYYYSMYGLSTYTVGNINSNVSGVQGSNALYSLDGQITNAPNSGNYFSWSAGILDYDWSYSGNTATINIPSNTTVNSVYNGNGWGFGAGIYVSVAKSEFTVNNSGTVSAQVNWNDGVAAGYYSYLNYGDQYINNNAGSSMTANASWYTSGIRALTNGGSVNVNQNGTLTATSGAGFQSPYTNTGWAVGMDLQTYSGNITATNTGNTTGTVKSGASSSSEACGAYIWANGGSGAGSSVGNMTFNNSGTFTANGAPNGAVKGVYCGGNGNLVSITNSGTITANIASGGFGWALETEIDGNGTMNITNTGTLTTNGNSGLYIVSSTSSDPNSGGTGPVRVENWGTIQGNGGINSWAYNGPISIYDHGTINGTSGYAINLSNSRADTIYVYGTPSVSGTMTASTSGSTLHLHIPAAITSISGGNGKTDSNLANDGLGTSGSITAGGHTYSWSNLTVSGSTASTTIANGTYKIINRNSGLALDDYNWGTGNGSKVDQWSYSGGANQKWNITYLGNGTYKIQNVYSGLVLDDNAWNTANGAVIDQWSVSGTPAANCQWIFTATDSGYYTISPADAPGSCVDIPYASTSNGAFIQLYTLADADTWPNGGWGQQWSLQAP